MEAVGAKEFADVYEFEQNRGREVPNEEEAVDDGAGDEFHSPVDDERENDTKEAFVSVSLRYQQPTNLSNFVKAYLQKATDSSTQPTDSEMKLPEVQRPSLEERMSQQICRQWFKSQYLKGDPCLANPCPRKHVIDVSNVKSLYKDNAFRGLSQKVRKSILSTIQQERQSTDPETEPEDATMPIHNDNQQPPIEFSNRSNTNASVIDGHTDAKMSKKRKREPDTTSDVVSKEPASQPQPKLTMSHKKKKNQKIKKKKV